MGAEGEARWVSVAQIDVAGDSVSALLHSIQELCYDLLVFLENEGNMPDLEHVFHAQSVKSLLISLCKDHIPLLKGPFGLLIELRFTRGAAA